MTTLKLAEAQLIAFVLLDSSGVEVTGLGTTFSVSISENGAAFAASAGTKAEIGSGWYSYELTAAETDTAGPLAVKVTGTGAVQQNLLYQVSGTDWEPGAGPNILTVTEASNVLRCAADDPNMLMLLPAVDVYLKMATGRDWAADTTIREEAKNAARMLLVRWHEDPGAMAAGSSLGFGLSACLVQLEALALQLETAGVPDEALKLEASVPPAGYDAFSVSANLVLIFNHAMGASATGLVTLEDANLDPVTTTNTLDATGKIMTIHPASSLASGARYTIVIDAAPDIYGQTLEKEISFKTA